MQRHSRRAVLALAVVASLGSAARRAAADTRRLTRDDEIAIRGRITVVDPDTRTIVVNSPERDELAYQVALQATNFSSLKPGLTVDLRYYRIVDFLVARTTPEVTRQADALVREPVLAPGMLGTELRIQRWKVSGLVVRVDLAAHKLEIVDRNGGSLYRTPWIKTPEGQATLAQLRPGETVTLVFSERTAFEVTPVR